MILMIIKMERDLFILSSRATSCRASTRQPSDRL